MARQRRWALVAAAIAALAACGSDEGGSDDGGGAAGADVTEQERPYYEAMVEAFQSGDTEEITLDGPQAECVSARWVRSIGVPRFEQAGITPDDIRDDIEGDVSALGLDDQSAGQLYDAFGACDIEVLDQLVEALAGGGQLSDDGVACLRDNLDGALVRDIFVVSFTGGGEALRQDPELTARLLEAFSACPGALPE